MARTAEEVVAEAVRELAPAAGANGFVPLVAEGKAPREAIAGFALEQHHIITSDRRSFHRLALRTAEDPKIGPFFDALAQGESVALERLGALAEAFGVDDAALRAYEPRAGCQAYPAYAAWLALHAEPADVVIALTVNFAAWGGYCADLRTALREHYGCPAEACRFLDFFAEPDPSAAEQGLSAVQAGLDAGRVTERLAHRYGRLLQAYELMFWNTLAQV
ncbi:thiaminase II/PqqC family protein [Streptomyces varsoviensis]|uniref:transcriptional regulator n=1 Tax=Streptomyces varsoviensis TaxID=67373 RepID=UPI0004CA5166|nr:transcriptional regulator [Streptomyces varsoviensis]